MSTAQEITIDEASLVLNVSRSFVARLIEAGVFSTRSVRADVRLVLAEIIAYRDESAKRQSDALDDMTREAEEFGLYD